MYNAIAYADDFNIASSSSGTDGGGRHSCRANKQNSGRYAGAVLVILGVSSPHWQLHLEIIYGMPNSCSTPKLFMGWGYHGCGNGFGSDKPSFQCALEDFTLL